MTGCSLCEGTGEVRKGDGECEWFDPCSACTVSTCVSCYADLDEFGPLCRRCRNLDTVADVCEQGRPASWMDYPHGVSHLIEDRDGTRVEHVVPHYQADDVLQQAITAAFYERTLA